MPCNFPDLEKVWKMKVKSGIMVKSLDFFPKAITSTLQVNFFYFGQILFNIANTFAAHREKGFVPAFSKVSIDIPFDNR